MTKEKLEKEAEENSFRYTLDKPWVCEVERKQIMAHFKKGYLAGAEPREERIHTLEVYLEGAVNYLIMAGDIDNRIISNVETILHMTFNRSPNVPNVFRKFTKAKELIKKFLVAKSIEDTCVAESEAEQFIKEIENES